MTNSALHFPFLRGRQGEIDALASLSPEAQGRVVPIVDLPTAELSAGESLEIYVGGFVRRLASAWGVSAPLYIDFTRYGPEQVDAAGRHIAEHLFDCARQLKLRAIPVTGPRAIRGPGTAYLDSIARVAARDRRGAAVRLPYEEFSSAATLRRELDAALACLSLAPDEVDVFFDAESLVLMNPNDAAEPALVATLREALSVVQSRPFRYIVFAASSVPDNLVAQPDGEPLVFERKELRVWMELVRAVSAPLVRFGDYAVWYPRQDDSGASGIAPARVRLPIGQRQVYFRAAAAEYRSLCRRALRYPGVSELPRSRGLTAVRECAAGYGPPGNATSWVARDTSTHIEATVQTLQAHLASLGRLEEIGIARLQPTPWLQESIVAKLEERDE